jgi:hypothetical protein
LSRSAEPEEPEHKQLSEAARRRLEQARRRAEAEEVNEARWQEATERYEERRRGWMMTKATLMMRRMMARTAANRLVKSQR